MNRTTTPQVHSWYLLSLLAGGHFLSDFYVNFLPILLPFAISQLGLSLTLSGMLTMFFSISSNFLQPVFGYYIDRSGYTWLLLLTIPISALFICLSGIVPSIPLLFLTVTLSGLAASLFHPLASSLVTKVNRPERQGFAVSLFVAGGNFGFALAPVILTFFFAAFSLDAILWLAIPGFLLTLAYWQSGLHKKKPSHSRAAVNEDMPKWYRSSALMKLNLVMSLRSWPQYALTTFLPILMAQRGYDVALIGILLTVFLAGGAVGGFVGGYLGDRYGCRICILCSLFLAIFPGAYFLAFPSTDVSAWIAIFLFGACMQSTVPSSVIWAQKIMPQNAAMVSGMMLGLAFGLGGVGAAITGVLADHIGLYTALLLTIVPLILTVPLTFTIKSPNQ